MVCHHFCAINQGAVPCNSKGILIYSLSMTDFSLLTVLTLPLFAMKAFFLLEFLRLDDLPSKGRKNILTNIIQLENTWFLINLLTFLCMVRESLDFLICS